MEFVFLIAILIFSVVIHEVSHGTVANALGDPTAKLAGRLTLNPIPHLDPVGSVLLPAVLALLPGNFIVGWAKPVPVNPLNLRDQKWGSAKVSLAGPGSNLLLALVFGLALRFLPLSLVSPTLPVFFSFIVFINLLLAVFNLLPIPPLDGSHILFSLLPRQYARFQVLLSQWGLVLLFLFILFLFPVLGAVVNLLFSLIVGAPL